MQSTDYARRMAATTAAPWQKAESDVADALSSLWQATAVKIGMDRPHEDVPRSERATPEFQRALAPPDWRFDINDCPHAFVEVKASTLESHGGWPVKQRQWLNLQRFRAERQLDWLTSIRLKKDAELPGYIFDLAPPFWFALVPLLEPDFVGLVRFDDAARMLTHTRYAWNGEYGYVLPARNVLQHSHWFCMSSAARVAAPTSVRDAAFDRLEAVASADPSADSEMLEALDWERAEHEDSPMTNSQNPPSRLQLDKLEELRNQIPCRNPIPRTAQQASRDIAAMKALL